jgi:hypothetical protein
MNKLLAKLIGRPAIENWKLHVADAKKSVEKLQKVSAPIGIHETHVTAARADFLADPSTAKLERWIQLESNRAATFTITQDIRNEILSLIEAAIAKGGEGKFYAACDEAESAIEEQQKKIVADDARRAEELGIPSESTAALAKLHAFAEQVEAARSWWSANPSAARSSLSTVVGEPM